MWRDPALHPLSHQHQHGLALCVLIDRGLKADPSEAKARELQSMVAAAWENELRAHFAVEEETLFPAVRERVEGAALIDELIGEHRELEARVNRVGDASAAELTDRLKELGDLLASHIRTEERRLFEEVQAALSTQEIAELGRTINDQVVRICPITARLPWESESGS